MLYVGLHGSDFGGTQTSNKVIYLIFVLYKLFFFSSAVNFWDVVSFHMSIFVAF